MTMIDLDTPTTRDLPLVAARACLLFVDVQNFCAHREGGEFKDLPADVFEARYGWFFRHIEEKTVPNMIRLQRAFRRAGGEVMYTTIENLTQDGRDRSLDYKITGFNVPKGSWDAKVIEAIAPEGDEIVLPKTSSNVFVSTTIDYVLRNLGIRQLVVCGFITDQCVGSAVRDACDLGYLVTLVTDGTATYSAERQERTLEDIKGYCRRATTDTLIAELQSPGP